MNDFIPSICTTRTEARDACMKGLARLHRMASPSLAVGDNSVAVSGLPAWDELNVALTKPRDTLDATMKYAINEYEKTFQ